MLKRLMVTLHHVITVYNSMFDHMNVVMRALAMKKTQWKEDLYFAITLAQQKLSRNHAEVTRSTGILLHSAHVLDPFQMLRSSRRWDKGMDINPEDETSWTSRYQEPFLKYVENEYWAKHRWLPVSTPEREQSNEILPCTSASGSSESSSVQYDLSSDNEEYLTTNNLPETTPDWSDQAACWLRSERLYLDSLSEWRKNWGQVNQNPTADHSDPIEISSTFWIPGITDTEKHDLTQCVTPTEALFGMVIHYIFAMWHYEYPVDISNKSSFHPKHPGVPDGSDGSDRTSYPLTENSTLPVAQATDRVA